MHFALIVAASLLAAPILAAVILRNTDGVLAGSLQIALQWIAWSIIALPFGVRPMQQLMHGPHAQARWFRPVTRLTAAMLGALLAAEGIVLAVTAFAVNFPAGSRAGHGDLLEMLVILALAAGCVVLACSTVMRAWRFTAGALADIDGILVGPERLPQLHAHVRRVAAQLGVEAPARILLGLRPKAFVSVWPIALRGRGLLPAAYTLGLPAIALRALSDAELGALIGHELAHFRAENAGVPQRPATPMPGLQASPQGDVPDRARGFRAVAAEIADNGVARLARRSLAAAGRREESAADRAGAQVAGALAMVAVLIKLEVLQLPWAKLLTQYRRRACEGASCRNLVADHMLVTQQFAVRYDVRTLRRWLLEEGTEPFDTHPSTADRAAALGVKLDEVIARVLSDLERPRETRGLNTLEEELTALEMQLARAAPKTPATGGGRPFTLR